MLKYSKSTRFHSIGTPLHGAGLSVQHDHEAYRSDRQSPEPTVCPTCQAIFHAGRWQWAVAPAGAHEAQCPACRRIRDGFPAGYVTIEGPFFREHREELMRLVECRATCAKAVYPLQRLMSIDDTEEGVCVATTDMHLARSIAEALHEVHRGELSLHYEDALNLLRAHWKR